MHHSASVLFWQTEKALPGRLTTHTEHVLAYQVAGRVEVEHGQPLLLGPGTLTVLPAGVPHRTLAGAQVSMWLMSFCATCFALDESQPLMEAFRRVRLGAMPVIALDGARQARLDMFFKCIQAEQNGHTPESGEMVKSLLILILGEANRAMREAQGLAAPGGADLVSAALAFIQAHCLSAISLRDVAAAVNRAPAHVATAVKKATGFSVGHWINAGRVAEAGRRLAHTDDSLAQVAERVGWQDVTHFIRQFRKVRGETPGAWRARHRADHQQRDADQEA